jgi:hypothetical protein
MTLKQAIDKIECRLDGADTAYGSVVFDEWIIAWLVGEQREIRHYFGPRTIPTDKELRADLGPLRGEILSGDYHTGDLEFVRNAEGKAFDAFIMAGMGIYVILNNVRKTIQEITANPKWHGAQVPLVQLSEAFRADPLSDRGFISGSDSNNS